jgi:Holliday junction resolvase RusA-like endonuclease
MQHFVVDIKPMGAVRMTQRGKWTNPQAQKYLAYKSEIQRQVRLQAPELIKQACEVSINFWMPIPESWSAKKKIASIGKSVTVKPDIDNLVKGLFDALNGLVWTDDNLVVSCNAMKIYSVSGKIDFLVEANP